MKRAVIPHSQAQNIPSICGQLVKTVAAYGRAYGLTPSMGKNESARLTNNRWLEKHHEKRMRICADYRNRHQERVKHNSRKSILNRKYNLTPGEFESRLKEQKNCCLICDGPFKGIPHIDHCHQTGKVRGILCFGCNVALGGFKDSPALLRRAAEYLESFSDKAQPSGVLPFVGTSGL